MNAIRFPRLHIAESVVNRILNAADDIQGGGGEAPARKAIQDGSSSGDGSAAATAAVTEDPAPPDPALQGAAIDLELAAPVPPVEPNPAVIQGAATGEAAPLEALLQPGGMA